MRRYIGLLHQNGGSDYTITIPDLPNCAARGRLLSDAVSLAASVASLHVKGMVESGDDVPVPSSFDTIMKVHPVCIFILVPIKV